MIRTVNQYDQELLEGILNANDVAIQKVYDLALPSVISWVKENNGEETDARDIFQDAIIALFRKVEEGDFVLSCTLKSYIRIICRNLWLSKLRKHKKLQLSPMETEEEVDLEPNMLEHLEQSEKEQLFFKHFDLLGDNCKKILQWFFDKVPLKEIAKRIDTSENYIKKRKFICKEQLVKAIQQDPHFEELKNID